MNIELLDDAGNVTNTIVVGAADLPDMNLGRWRIAEPPAPVPEPPTVEQIKAALIAAVQGHLDATAESYGYSNIYTACTYADEPAVAVFQAEGQALRAWRSLVWAHCHGVMAAVMGAQRTAPTPAELIAELPALAMS